MQRKLLATTTLLLIIGLFSNPQALLAKEKTPITNNITTNQNTKITRLEISLSRRKITFYRQNTPIKSYPVAVGKAGWETPQGNFTVLEMWQNPTWINPLTDEAIAGGDPENPLGRRWIGFWTDGINWIGLHGTSNPKSIGKAVSHGCVRMHNKDIEELFAKVKPGTPIRVVP